MKCPNCGEENPEGMKFCGNCGTKLPEPMNHCPHCNKDWPLTMKFCGECGFSFGGNGAAKSAGISMGDKNVIAGDVIGSNEETHIAGNATIIKNEDETKKTAKCHVCGRIVMRIDGFDCPVCGQFTCASCYDIQNGRCKFCINQSESSKINQYKETFQNFYSDKRIDLSERRELINLQHKLGLSDDKIKEIEASITKESSSSNNAKYTTVENININKAQTLYYDEGKSQEAINLLKPIYAMHKTDENILNLYFPILADIDEAQAENEIKQLSFDNLSACLTIFDIALRKKEYDEAERRLDKLVMLWPENVLVKCSQAFFKYGLYKEFHVETFLQDALELAQDLGTAETPLEKSYQEKAKFIMEDESDSPTVNYTKDYCRQNGFYWKIINDAAKMFNKAAIQGNETAKSNLTYAQNNQANTSNTTKEGTQNNSNTVTADNSVVINQLIKKAEQGDVEASVNLGEWYRYGQNVKRNYGKAEKWYIKALENKPDEGMAAACAAHLGAIYNEGGFGLKKDSAKSNEWYSKAIRWYSKIAEQGDAKAPSILGHMYKIGDGVAQDYSKAVEWYTKAFENQPNGDMAANYASHLGSLYKEGGFGLKKDSAKSNEWYSKAIRWYSKAAEQGDADAQDTLGYMYQFGNGVTQDYSKAVEWYTKAAEQGFATAQCHLGNMYYQGLGVIQDISKAIKWLKKAAEQGNGIAQHYLTSAQYNLTNNNNTPKDVTQNNSNTVKSNKNDVLKELIEKAEQGDKKALIELIRMYRNGDGVEKSYKEATKWYKKAEEHGYENVARKALMFHY